MHSLSSTPPVYIYKAHQNTSGSVVSELMRFIHHIITYVVPATPRAINWAYSNTRVGSSEVICDISDIYMYTSWPWFIYYIL